MAQTPDCSEDTGFDAHFMLAGQPLCVVVAVLVVSMPGCVLGDVRANQRYDRVTLCC
jgi:hypothetical protein